MARTRQRPGAVPLRAIGNIPPAEAEERYYAMPEQSAVAA